MVENGGAAWSPGERAVHCRARPGPHLHVRVAVRRASDVDPVRLDALVAAAKPAHLGHTVEVVVAGRAQPTADQHRSPAGQPRGGRPRVILCRKCGHQNADDESFCTQCNSYLEWSGDRVGSAKLIGPAPRPRRPCRSWSHHHRPDRPRRRHPPVAPPPATKPPVAQPAPRPPSPAAPPARKPTAAAPQPASRQPTAAHPPRPDPGHPSRHGPRSRRSSPAIGSARPAAPATTRHASSVAVRQQPRSAVVAVRPSVHHGTNDCSAGAGPRASGCAARSMTDPRTSVSGLLGRVLPFAVVV